LLAADTFSHGRLTNQTHALWQHFESFHINHQPSYMSMYPPAQGIALAIGQILGHPWLGVLLGASLMCASLTWALQGWMPPTWALLGGGIAILRLALFSSWGNSYYGGAVPAIGGALLLGAVGRLLRAPSAKLGGTAAVGAVILANSRPYEGLVVCIALGVATAFLSRHRWTGAAWRAVLSPAMVVLACAGLAMLYYNWRVYGSPLTLPYTTNRARYAVAPVFLWQHPKRVPEYRHEVMRKFYTGWELDMFEKMSGRRGYSIRAKALVLEFGLFYIGPLLTVPLVFAIAWIGDSQRITVPILALGSCVAAVAMSAFTMPHYFSPATAALYVILLRSFRIVWIRQPALVRTFCIAIVIAAAIRLGLTEPFPNVYNRNSHLQLSTGRRQIVDRLTALGGRHLLVVRYSAEHDPGQEWVYNAADIDGSRIVWAREMDDNRALFDYFRDRRAWLLEPDAGHLSPLR
jgi:hypothetical protein